MNILYVTPYVPSLIRTRPYNLIRALVQLGHSITLLTAAGTSPEEQAEARELASHGVRTEVFPVARARSLLNCLLALPTTEPLQAMYAYNPRMERRLVQLLKDEPFDVVHIEHLRASRLASAVTRTSESGGMPLVYDSVDSISLLFEQAAQSGAQWRSRLMTAVDLERTRHYEAQLLTRYDQVVVTSRRDKEALERLVRQYLPQDTRAAPVTVVTNGVDLEHFQPQKRADVQGEQTVVFTGKMSYHANIAAALHFAREVLPHIWAKDPKVRFQIVGKEPPGVVRQLAEDSRIHVTGTVDDVRPYLAQATMAVCPVQYAVGVQNKVLEAMAMGKPVVCTSAAFTSLNARDGREALVAHDPEEFAAHVVRICSNPSLAQRLATAGRQYVENHHNWETAARRLVGIYELARSEARKE